MKILIAGCGKVGQALVQELSEEGHDLTLVDMDSRVLEIGMERFDVISVQGNCASMQTMRRAGVENANLLIACTGSDELNLLACATAHVMNPKIHTIARVRNPEYTQQAYEMRKAFGLSMTFNPELQAAVEIERLLKMPGFLKRETFAKGRVEIVEIRIDESSKLRDIPLSMLNSIVKCKVLVCTVLREGQTIMPDGHFVLREGDRIFVTAPSDNLAMLLKNLGIVTHKIRRALIIGGGTISYYVAQRLESSSIDATIMESDKERCMELATALPQVDVICENVRGEGLLESEELSDTDALISLTDSDELNMVLSLCAHQRGLPQVVTRLEQLGSVGITERLPIGSVICPNQLCCSNIVRYVRAKQNKVGAAITLHSIADGQAEALEFLVDENTLYCGTPLKKMKLRPNILLVGITSQNGTEIPSGDSVYNVGDSVVLVAGGDAVIGQFNDIFA